jgi:hypothetical protein
MLSIKRLVQDFYPAIHSDGLLPAVLSPSSLTLDHEAACALGLRWIAHGRSP